MTGANMISRPGYMAFAENHTFRFTHRSRCRQADPSFQQLASVGALSDVWSGGSGPGDCMWPSESRARINSLAPCPFQQCVARLPGDYPRPGTGKALRLLRFFNKQHIRPVSLSYTDFFLTSRILRQGYQLMTATQGTDPHHRISYAPGQCKDKAARRIAKQLPHLMNGSEHMRIRKFSACFRLYNICRARLYLRPSDKAPIERAFGYLLITFDVISYGYYVISPSS